MAKGTREIRRKIKSIKSTRQITKAMELVSASKMRRAVSNTLALRPYARLAEALLISLSDKARSKVDEEKMKELYPLLAKRPVKKVLAVVISSDRGLCGSLNAQLFRKVTSFIDAEKKKHDSPEISFVAVGKKAQEFLRRMNQKVVGAFPAMSAKPTHKDTSVVSRLILQDYEKGLYDKVMLIYTDFVSAISQNAVIRRLLPLSKAALEEMVDGIETGAPSRKKAEVDVSAVNEFSEYLFEPSPEVVLQMLLPRLTEMQVYQAVLEATASEHSARMLAMRNATDNATEFIDDLTLMYNSLRQASITQELAEISAGRAALG